MRYLKRFNESVDLESQLRDFSESYLAYLLDDGYTVNITQASDHLGGGGLPPNAFLIKLSNIDFTWSDVKESYIPFLHMLNREYNIVDQSIMFYYRFTGNGTNFSSDTEFDIETILSGNPLPNGFDSVDLIEILVWVTFDKPIKESVELKTDDIEHYLAYLIDEDFEVKSIIKGGGFGEVKPQQSINMERKLTREELNSIYNCGLTHKVVILGIGNNPLKVFDQQRHILGHRKESLLSSYNCGLLTQIDDRAHEVADRLLLDFTGFSTSKIIISFKVGEGQYQQHDFGNLSIRLQIILIE